MSSALHNKDQYRKILEIVDEGWLSRNIEKLWKTELGQTFTDYHNAAELTVCLMKEAGLDAVEKIPFPADGKTIYQDKISPLAWDAACGKLTVLKSPVALEDNVVADYKRHPFHLIKGSVSTPPEGLDVRLITWEQITHGQDAHNTMVILDPDTPPRNMPVRYILDAGALGWINTSLRGRYLTPDGICWMNACTEGDQWHVQMDDRPFIGFSVSPRTGDALLSAARKGEVLAHVECDGRRHKGTVDVVTGTIPGKEEKEFWLLAHLYEPLADDNSLGVVAGIHMAKILKTLFDSGALPEPRFTLRLVCGLEMYGFAAYMDKRGGNLGNKVIGAVNLDGFACRKKDPVDCWMSPPPSRFFGNSLFEEMAGNVPADILPDVTLKIKREGAYFDDMTPADPTVGIPVIWPLTHYDLHHNSCQTMEMIELPVVKQYAAFFSAFTSRILTMDDGQIQALMEKSVVGEMPDFTAEETVRTSVWWKIAETIIPERMTTGFPYDLAKVPKDERRSLPERCIYGAFARVLADMDGSKNLKHLILQAEWESKQEIPAQKVREYLGAVEYLAEYGYLKNRYTLTIKKKDIVASIEETGIEPGDLVIVHSGLSHLGHIEGGADTVIDAFLEVLGKEGTLLFPTFTISYIYFNGDCIAGRQCYPFDIKNTSVNVGRIPSVFLKRKGVVRSVHPTHSVAGTGPLAEECLTGHQPLDPPTCHRSPFGKLLENGGKMAWFGADLATTTFFHFLEDELDMPYLAEAVCRVKKKDGSIGTVLVNKHLPGHRDFYRTPAEESKMYSRLLKKGLVIRRVGLGFGEIKVIDAKQMYDLGIKALKEDQRLLLCDDKNCRFCSKYGIRFKKG